MLKLIQKKLADKTVSVSQKKHIHRVFSLQYDLGMEISPECQLSFSNKHKTSQLMLQNFLSQGEGRGM